MDGDAGRGEAGERRWERARRAPGSRRWLGPFLVIVVVPILIGAAVVLIAGRGVAFEAIRRLTAHKFPDVQWVSTGRSGAMARGCRADAAAPARCPHRDRVSGEPTAGRGPHRSGPTEPPTAHGRATNDPIVVYSSVGYRGARLAHWLEGQGFTNVRNLAGGIFEWANEDRPVVRDARPTPEVHPYDRRWGLLLESRFRATAPDVVDAVRRAVNAR